MMILSNLIALNFYLTKSLYLIKLEWKKLEVEKVSIKRKKKGCISKSRKVEGLFITCIPRRRGRGSFIALLQFIYYAKSQKMGFY